VRRQEDDLLTRAQGVRGVHATLEFAAKGPWPEPQQPMSHWSFLLKEMRWLATDVYQASFGPPPPYPSHLSPCPLSAFLSPRLALSNCSWMQ